MSGRGYEVEQIGDCMLYCGHAEDVLSLLEIPQAVLITDPPYHSQVGQPLRRSFQRIKATLNGGCSYEILKPFSRWVVFCSKDQLPSLLALAWQRDTWEMMTWNKTNPLPLAPNRYLPDVEYIIHAYRHGAVYGSYKDRHHYFLSGVNDWPRYSAHPTEKPLALMRKLIRGATQLGELVVDPYAGSFTTAHACLQLGRRCIAIECMRSYWEQGCQRLEAAYAQPGLFPVQGSASPVQEVLL